MITQRVSRRRFVQDTTATAAIVAVGAGVVAADDKAEKTESTRE